MQELVNGVDHVGLTVTDLDRSIRFYTEVLECTVAFQQEKKGGYLAAIVGYPDADVRMAHLDLPGGGPRLELFEYRTPKSAPAISSPVTSATPMCASSSTTPSRSTSASYSTRLRCSARRSRLTPG